MVKIQPKTLFVGKKLTYLPTCHSTNDIAAEIIQKGKIINGTVIVTAHQTGGKGQRGNLWESEPNDNLLMSIIIDSSFLDLKNQFYLSIITALAIHSTLESLHVENIKIKWPNDAYINEKKIGGILIESTLIGNRLSSSIIGIGINVNQKVFSSKRATSILNQNFESKLTPSVILEKLCENFEKYYLELKNKNFQKINSAYLKNLLWINEVKSFRDKKGIFFGKISGILPNGQLIVCTKNEEKYYDIKEIEFLFND